MGAVLGGLATLIGVLFGIFRAPEIIDALKSHRQLKSERDEARAEAQRERRRAESAERWAQNADGAADRAEDTNDNLERRLAALEEKMSIFDQLLEYARRLFAWAIKAERTAKAGGIQLEPIPPVPDDLADRLQLRQEAV